MAKTFNLEILTPTAQFYKGDIELIVVNTVSGEEGFMADHSWAIKLLKEGKARFQEAGHDIKDMRFLKLKDGYIDVRENVLIYTDGAEWAE